MVVVLVTVEIIEDKLPRVKINYWVRHVPYCAWKEKIVLYKKISYTFLYLPNTIVQFSPPAPPPQWANSPQLLVTASPCYWRALSLPTLWNPSQIRSTIVTWDYPNLFWTQARPAHPLLRRLFQTFLLPALQLLPSATPAMPLVIPIIMPYSLVETLRVTAVSVIKVGIILRILIIAMLLMAIAVLVVLWLLLQGLEHLNSPANLPCWAIITWLPDHSIPPLLRPSTCRLKHLYSWSACRPARLSRCVPSTPCWGREKVSGRPSNWFRAAMACPGS